MEILLVICSVIGVLICSIMLIISAIKKNRQIKKWYIGLAGCFLVFSILINKITEPPITVISDNASSEVVETTKPKTEAEIKAEKEAEAKAAKEAEIQAKKDAEATAKEEAAEKARAKAEAIAEAEKAKAFVAANTKKFSPGSYTIGKHISPGRYTVTSLDGSGNFFIYGKDGLPIVNEILGNDDLGVKKVVAMAPDGGKIQISGINKVKFVPYQPAPVTTIKQTMFCAGYFITGVDIAPGRYIASHSGSGSGNFIIYSGADNSPKANEILGGDLGVKEVTVDLEPNDIIHISSLNKVIFNPTN